MGLSSGNESGKALKLHSRDSGGISPRGIEIEITSTSSSGESQPENFDGYHGDRDRDSSLRLEMDLFSKSQFSAVMSSYSSSDNYSEEYFRVMPSEETKTDKDVLLSHENSNTATASSSSTEPASMVSDVAHESLMHCVSPVRSPPPLQMMDRLGGYQPVRILSSVFERSPGSTPVEWSIASNESLFSIHIGNISFSKDRFLMVSGELQKSGELPQLDEVTSTSQLPEYNENASDGPLAELERNFRVNEIAAKMSNGDMLNEENDCVMITEKIDDPIVTRMMPSLNNERHHRSSALPVKKKEKKKKSTCSCSCPKPGFRWLRTICCWTNNCACPLCSWPSCQCQYPSFDCRCTAPSCCDCSCLNCCFKLPSCCIQGCCSYCKCTAPSSCDCSCLNCCFKLPSCSIQGCCSYCKCTAPSCCDCSCLTCCFKLPSCCIQGCCFCCFPSRNSSAVKSELSSSCWSCHCSESCCTCSSCCTLSFSHNFCCSSCFGCHRKCRCFC